MSQIECPRSFEAEALRDGRLTGSERVNFERHLAACAACASEVAELDALARLLHQGKVVDELHERRQRVRLLAAFDASLVKPERALRSHQWLFAAGIGSVLCVAAWAAWRPTRTTSAQATNVRVQAAGAAVWSTEAHGTEETVKLESGSLRIHVDHARAHTHLVVAVPDGELEDIGTTFNVNVEGGRTTRVSVDEGRVLVRLRGLPARTLNAGETWLPSPLPATAAGGPLASAPAEPPQAPPPRSASSDANAGFARAAPHASVESPAADFRAAMAALARGDNRQAEAMLGAFLQKHPRDAHAEDAAYSQVIALQRCGDGARMQQAAAQYLARYPAGFRREEVAALAR